jgi:hypothetical protein
MTSRTLLYQLLVLLVSIYCTGCDSQVESPLSQNKDGIAQSPISTASTPQAPLAATIESVAVTATPSPVSAQTSPLLPSSELLSYQGEGNYAGMAQFEVLFDPAVWELINEPESYNNRLSNLREPSCIIGLQTGAVGSTTVDRVILAGREWFINHIHANVINYLFLTDTQGTAYIFGVVLPEDYRDGTKSSCQLMAEEVIDTFSLVDE